MPRSKHHRLADDDDAGIGLSPRTDGVPPSSSSSSAPPPTGSIKSGRPGPGAYTAGRDDPTAANPCACRRSHCILIAVALAVVGVVVCAAFAFLRPPAHVFCRSTLIILRHGERPPTLDRPLLSSAGQARAEYIETCMRHRSRVLSRGLPSSSASVLVAAKPKPGSRRCLDTLLPLAARLNQSVEATLDQTDSAGFLKRVGRLKCGSTMLVAWPHENIPGLLLALSLSRIGTGRGGLGALADDAAAKEDDGGGGAGDHTVPRSSLPTTAQAPASTSTSTREGSPPQTPQHSPLLPPPLLPPPPPHGGGLLPGNHTSLLFKWPNHCPPPLPPSPYPPWSEPRGMPFGECYDLVLKLGLHRTRRSGWRATGKVGVFHQGFNGTGAGPCLGDLARL